MSLTPIETRVTEIIAAHAAMEGPLLPVLHAVQAEFGRVPQEALPVLARELNISRAEVHGVVSFYHDFREMPAGRHVLKLCRAEACQAMGGTSLAQSAMTLLGVDWHGTTANGAVTLEPVYCLGLCACAPAAMLDGRVIGRVDASRLAEIAGECGV